MLDRVESKLSPELEDLIHRVIGCAIEVHRHLGLGFLESIYKRAMCLELADQSIAFESEKAIDVFYKERLLHAHRIDLIVEKGLIIELKAISRLEPIHQSQVVSYLSAAKLQVGLLINFNSVLLKDGVKRVVR